MINLKTELLLIGTRQKLAKVYINWIRVGPVDVSTAAWRARDLGVWLDLKLTMFTYIVRRVLYSSIFLTRQEIPI